RGVPRALASRQRHGVQPAGMAAANVRHREIGVLGIDRGPPFDAAERAAFTGAVLPQHLALAIRVDGPADPRLLADDEDVLAAGKRRKRWRRPEIEVLAALVDAV